VIYFWVLNSKYLVENCRNEYIRFSTFISSFSAFEFQSSESKALPQTIEPRCAHQPRPATNSRLRHIRTRKHLGRAGYLEVIYLDEQAHAAVVQHHAGKAIDADDDGQVLAAGRATAYLTGWVALRG
jgi:hypothetical protein